MKTKAVRLYDKNDLRLEEFELPHIKNDEILCRVVSDSLCMSSYKAAVQGASHKRVPDNIKTNPIIIGHEFCGEIVEVGEKWADKFKPGQKFAIQPAVNYNNTLDAVGYSFEYAGGNATYVILPKQYMEKDCLFVYEGDAFFFGSLAEPMSCIVGAFKANYHTTPGSYVHQMGIKEGGACAILAGAGPMGLGAIDLAVNGKNKPSLLVVTEIDDNRLERASKIITVEHAQKNGVKLIYVNTAKYENPNEYLMSLTDNKGFDDVFVFAPVAPLVEQADKLLGFDGCLNFFAGPTDTEFSAKLNFYNVHYGATHIAGTSGGNNEDLLESLDMMAKGIVNPAAMITHIGGLDAVIDATLNLPKIPGGKKLIYTNISLPLTAITDFAELSDSDPIFKGLYEITSKNGDIWNKAAEDYLLKNAKPI